MKRAISALPAILAFVLLVFQAAIPWMAEAFVTQDGPSHLYTARVLRDLITDAESAYAPFYRIDASMATNWGIAIVLNILAAMTGFANAERVLATLCVVIGFFGFSRLFQALQPEGAQWTPIVNLLVNSWFLWIGFYNFHLGMSGCAMLLAYTIECDGRFTLRQAAGVGTALLALSFVHLHPASLAFAGIGISVIWLRVVIPGLQLGCRATLRDVRESLVSAGFALAPTGILLAEFLFKGSGRDDVDSQVYWALTSFPFHVFASGSDRLAVAQDMTCGLRFLLPVALLSLTRRDWLSARGAIVILAAVSFVLYLIVPNAAFGADEIKIRYAWAVFIFGLSATLSSERLASLRTGIALMTSVFLAGSLGTALFANSIGAGRAAAQLQSVLSQVPEKATLIRVRYPTPKLRKHYGYPDIALEPLLHAEAGVAARNRWTDLTDYQALSGNFPLAARPEIVGPALNANLAGLEGANEGSAASLKWIVQTLPLRVDYVLVVGDEDEASARDMRSNLDQSMELVGTDINKQFVWLYRRKS